MEGTTTCPGDFYCIDGSRGYSAIPPALHSLPACVALVSSSLSLMGAALNMIAYCAFKDLRKGTAQTIIAVLAMVDFVGALMGIFGASIHLAYGNIHDDLLRENDCNNFDTLCQIQAFVGLWTLGSSFTWTSVLAIHFFFMTVCTHSWPQKLMPIYNIVGWLVPLSLTLPMLLLGKLGYVNYLTWTCFIRSSENNSNIQWDVLEIITAVSIFVGYTSVLIIVILKSRQQLNPVRKVSKRMLTLLIVFLLLRIWGLGLSLTNSTPVSKSPLVCSNLHIQTAGFIFNTFLAVAAPGQGWINCILYIFLSLELRKRMFVLPFQRVWRRLVKKNTQRQLRELEITPLLEDATNALSEPIGRQDGGTHTYLSLPTEFPHSNQE